MTAGRKKGLLPNLKKGEQQPFFIRDFEI